MWMIYSKVNGNIKLIGSGYETEESALESREMLQELYDDRLEICEEGEA